MLAIFNLGAEAVKFDWAAAKGAVAVDGHGLEGSVADGVVSLPAFGGWFGTV